MIVIAGRCGAIEWIADPPPQSTRRRQSPYGTASATRLSSNRCSVWSGPSHISSTSLRCSTSGCGCGCAPRRLQAAPCLQLQCCPSCSAPSTRCTFKCSSTQPTFQPSLTCPAFCTHPLAFLMRRAPPHHLVRTAFQQTLLLLRQQQQLLTTVQRAHASQHSTHCCRHSCPRTGNLLSPSALIATSHPSPFPAESSCSSCCHLHPRTCLSCAALPST